MAKASAFKKNSAQRLKEYTSRWGAPISTETIEVLDDKSISIHCFKAIPESDEVNNGKPFHVLITDGLSDTAIIEGAPRTEFIWYVEKPEEVHYSWLTFISIVHLVDEVDLYQSTLPIAAPPSNEEPLAKGSLLSSATFITPLLVRDQDSFIVDGDETYTLWVLPITEAERTHLQKHGEDFVEALSDLLAENEHPFVLNPLRKKLCVANN